MDGGGRNPALADRVGANLAGERLGQTVGIGFVIRAPGFAGMCGGGYCRRPGKAVGGGAGAHGLRLARLAAAIGGAAEGLHELRLAGVGDVVELGEPLRSIRRVTEPRSGWSRRPLSRRCT
jgi:hypothetical protein